MIRVTIERRPKEGKKAELTARLRELRSAALHRPGYITGETLENTEDTSDITVIGTWRSIEEWKAWEASKARENLCQRVAPLLTEKPRVRTYQIMATD